MRFTEVRELAKWRPGEKSISGREKCIASAQNGSMSGGVRIWKEVTVDVIREIKEAQSQN
jgi:hypothetical protein